MAFVRTFPNPIALAAVSVTLTIQVPSGKHGFHFQHARPAAADMLEHSEKEKRRRFSNNGRRQSSKTPCRRVLDDCDVSVLRLLLVERFYLPFEWHLLRCEIKAHA